MKKQDTVFCLTYFLTSNSDSKGWGEAIFEILSHPWLVSSISSESIEGLRDLNYLSMVEKQPCDHLVRSECVLDSLQIHKSDLVPGK